MTNIPEEVLEIKGYYLEMRTLPRKHRRNGDFEKAYNLKQLLTATRHFLFGYGIKVPCPK
jgi:hypothetical protein